MISASSLPIYNYKSLLSQFAESPVNLVWLVVWLAFAFLIIILPLWKIFEKAGQDGWKAIIPIYNTIILLKISGLNPWLVILTYIPYIKIVMSIIIWAKLSKAFGKGVGFTLGLIFLDGIFLFILAFGSAKYNNQNLYDN